MPGDLIDRLRRGGLTGTWCSLASFAAVEVMATLRFDFLVLDLQHTEMVLSQIPALLGAAHLEGVRAVVRAPECNYHAINWLCDQGADGVLVPMVNSAEDAAKAVGAAKYPPLGRRSFGPLRASRYGAGLGEYMTDPNSRTALIVQIEDAGAARDIEKILQVPGIDAVFMGPNDLALSMLKPGETIRGDASQWSAFARTPEVLELCDRVLRACRAAGIPFGMTTADGTDAGEWFGRGAQFVTMGSDVTFLRAGARSVRAAEVRS
jgi:2-keto-3-deoxy-L-rhamnonate aldolase RhmA